MKMPLKILIHSTPSKQVPSKQVVILHNHKTDQGVCLTQELITVNIGQQNQYITCTCTSFTELLQGGLISLRSMILFQTL